MIEKTGPSSPILQNSSPTPSFPIVQNSTSSLQSINSPNEPWALRVVSHLYSLIRDFFKVIFGRPTAISLPSEVQQIQPMELGEQSTSNEEPEISGYAALELTSVEKENIRFIFKTIANTKSYFALLFNDKVKEKGMEIEHVHPYKLLKELLTTDLKSDLLKIKEMGWPRPLWNYFIKNLSKSFNSKSNESLLLYLSDFANEVGCDPSLLEEYIKTQNWEIFVIKLLETQPVAS